MSYTLKIDNTTYYFDTKEVMDEAEKAIEEKTSNAEKQQVIENQYLNKKKCATSEDDLAELSESDEVDNTHMSERKTEEVTEYKIKQNDVQSYCDKYVSELGISSCGEDIDKWVSSFENFKTKAKILEDKINSLDTLNPEEIDEAFKEYSSALFAFPNYASATGVEVPNADYTWANHLVCGGVTAGAIGGLGAVMIGTSATVASIPVAGWIVGGIGLITGGIILGVEANKQNETKRKAEKFKKDVEEMQGKLLDNQCELQNKVEDASETIGGDTKKELNGLLGTSFCFDDIKDTNCILNNMDKLLNAQKKLLPYAQLGEKYGFDTSNINTLINTLGGEDNPFKQANNYIRSYASAITQAVTFNKDLVKDTESYNKFHANVKGVIEDASNKGINVEPLQTALHNMQSDNQAAEKTTASSITNPYSLGSGYSGTYQAPKLYDSVKDLINSSNEATEISSGVQEGSTSYDTLTDDLDDVIVQLLGEAQDIVDDYSDIVSKTDSDTVEELSNILQESTGRLDELTEVQDKVSSSKLKSSVDEIPEKQQEIISKEAESFLSVALGTNDGGELADILSQIDEKIETYNSLNVDTTKLNAALESIVSNQQKFINTCAQNIMSSKAQTVEDWNNIMLETIDILENQSPIDGRVDLTALNAVISEIPEKQQEIILNEVQEFVSSASGTNEGDEIRNILSRMDEKIEVYDSLNVDTSKFDVAIENIISNQQKYLNEEEKNAASKIDAIENISDGESVIQDLNSLISANSSFTDVSGLENIISKIQEKINKLNKKDKENKENYNDKISIINKPDDKNEENIINNDNKETIKSSNQTEDITDKKEDTPQDIINEIISENAVPNLAAEEENLNEESENKDYEISEDTNEINNISFLVDDNYAGVFSEKTQEEIKNIEENNHTEVPDKTTEGEKIDNEEDLLDGADEINTFNQTTETFNPDDNIIKDKFKQTENV